ncbi:hypothetical protein [Devosia submarina]|uniref:hypothetical protein n=1 Tax=Devosia submarina TaxID=1173082 RepID=UPI000D3388F9|nr:hypothetical protein [Devosia submarina]
MSIKEKQAIRMLESIPDWIEILFGVLATQIPNLLTRPNSRRRRRERELHVKWGSLEWKSRRKDDDQS